jgi:hypothetical protein
MTIHTPISWNEIKSRAIAFSREWQDESSEDAEAKSFWDAFFNIFGVSRRRLASFERRVKKADGADGYIDVFWKGVLLVEHKSRGKSLDRAYSQAKDYFSGIKDRDLPRYILVSDFASFRLYDLDANTQHDFAIKELQKNVRLFGFVAGYESRSYGKETQASIRAVEKLGVLHDQLEDAGYKGHDLERLMVRLLFCMFAEDAGAFEPRQFQDYVEQRTKEDGSDLGQYLAKLFEVLNQPEEARGKNLDEQLAAFRYVNGKLFDERLAIPDFTSTMRESLLEAAALDWAQISPAIFGSLFQSIKDRAARRAGGEHYTSEQNILKALRPLFLDKLHDELKAATTPKKLKELHVKLRGIRILDPACGCGNFLVVAYRELRLLELEILKRLRDEAQLHLVNVNVDQFYGIEIEEFPAEIAQVALWLTDHQMNMQVSEVTGNYYVRLPLKTAPHILCGNALTTDWSSLIAPKELSYIVGNPPFVGHQWRIPEQVLDMERVWGSDGRFGRLDFVACWHRKTADYMASNKNIRAAFVSTNSITQGEQAGILWPNLFERGVRINFAHRTFQWTSEARGKAAVHCVIIGFALEDEPQKWLFDYITPKSEPHVLKANRLNGYLIDAPDVALPSRGKPLSGMMSMNKGSQPTDGGNLIMSEQEKNELLAHEPDALPFLRPYIGGDEFLSGGRRWCLWLKDASPEILRRLPRVMRRVDAVREARAKSPTQSVREYANLPTLFTQDRQPDSPYLALPEVSSENRRYLPIGFLPPEVIASNKLQIIAGATYYLLGVMSSEMHMAWMRTVCGRLESRYSYSPSVYNNFPWPEPTDKQRESIEKLAQAVLEARAAHKGATLADLYDPNTMPVDLLKAHQALDRAVDAAYGAPKFSSEAERVKFLFALYQKITAPLDVPAPVKKKARQRK